MKQKTVLLMVLLVLASIGAAWTAPIQITGSVSAVMKHLTRSVPPPKTDNKDIIAAEIDIRFPELSSRTGTDPVVEAINKAIQNRLLAIADEKPASSVNDLMETFAKGYEQSVKESPDQPGAWSLKFDATIRHADKDLLCLETIDSIFTGGAHPNSNITYQVFSMQTGKPLELSALVTPDKMGELTRIAENHFRRIRNLKPDETFEQAGFQFEQNRFALNQNFLVSKDGLAFCFNPYEIAPYAMGVTELVIPWNDLRAVVNPDGPAARFLKKSQ
ncbi:MAG TPA: DUF3298 domain-containing protein [Candidatus Ozemobacteraceae bacterium]|mgnify:CR=1 FL=1|nr:DUF3298 domain-containing protein [Candidatus Ozemobacteraceae bacterium]